MTQFFTELFSDGFESGDFSAWTGTNGAIAVVGSPVHHGSYACQVDANQEYVYTSFAGQTALYARVYVRWTVNPSSGSSYTMFWCGTGALSSRVIFGVANEAGTVKWRLGAYVVPSTFEYITFGSPAPQVDTWYCVELQNVADTAGGAFLYVDGNLIGSVVGTTLPDSLGFLTLGTYSNLPSSGAGFYDCAVVADAYIGPEEEATIKTVMDSFSLSESVLRNKTLILSDSLALADALYGNKALLLPDSASLSDLVAVIVGEVMKYVVDSVSSADSASTPSRVLRTLEAIGATDNAVVNKVLQITETISLAETAEIGVGGVKKTRLFLILGDLAVQLTGD